jgi:hypothetical protein
MIPFSDLSISAAWRPGTRDAEGGGKTERHFWDFVVDGISLRSTWHDSDTLAWDSVGVLGWGDAEFEVESVAKLLVMDNPTTLPIGLPYTSAQSAVISAVGQ